MLKNLINIINCQMFNNFKKDWKTFFFIKSAQV